MQSQDLAQLLWLQAWGLSFALLPPLVWSQVPQPQGGSRPAWPALLVAGLPIEPLSLFAVEGDGVELAEWTLISHHSIRQEKKTRLSIPNFSRRERGQS